MKNFLFPRKIRVSSGSASLLDLNKLSIDVNPTTCYLMTYTDDQCIGKCGFCPQGYNSDKKSAKKLSRIQWPVFEFTKFLKKLKENQKSTNNLKFKRLCLQVLNYSGFYNDVHAIISNLHENFPKLAISSAIPPINNQKMQNLYQAGMERIGIALDSCTSELFSKIKGKEIKGPYSWELHWKALNDALKIFGKGKTTIHLIIGMGESEKEAIDQIFKSIQKEILPGIFLFTPIKGTPMENVPRPSIIQFRHVQIARYLLLTSQDNYSRFKFNSKSKLEKIKNLSKSELKSIIEKQIAFKTAGCPDCNRPFYNSSPNDEQDGFPRDLTVNEKQIIFDELKSLI